MDNLCLLPQFYLQKKIRMKNRLRFYIFGVLVLYFGFRVTALILQKLRLDFSDIVIVED